MNEFTHDTACTRYAEGGEIRFAYRRFGIPGRPPLVFFQHFMGTLDDHDPALGAHQSRGVETPAFRPGRKRRFTSPGNVSTIR